ncbi:diguanylate cyclase [Vibrio vulnificus]|uniref:sensor domain-containing diguanylate cyclase n=1 Tax=Vibrio vulnificus TaxID=672 RepID=UPI0005F18842|nr:sensor domain-containing diguanylate cyclase [Vibrio vulnificus]EHS1182395.1 diguanylate cyclase [Vibrio vulnificus]EHU5003821.1 diguanylate cyclase [Vibrio vulnificus]EJS4042718.1 diguanylate cyclase [Vibrio vulnificus]MBN8033669.1 diguanylate cyclase [Vibrio vulnificus]HDY8038746.1 diguanylate cyclase [Vibrio vulnificus]
MVGVVCMVEQSIFSRVIANNPSVVHHIFEALPEPTFLIDAEGYYIEAWGGTDSKRHHDPANLIGLNQYQVLPREKAIWFSDVIQQVIQSQKPQELEYELHPKDLGCFDGVDGPTELQFFSAFVIPLMGEKKVLWTVRNITEYKMALRRLESQQLELERLSCLDHLTQLFNRYALEIHLPHALSKAAQSGHSAALFMVDIDCFKDLNDTFGHLTGDKALRMVAMTLKQWSGEKGIGFRYGGDEFLIFIQDISKQACEQKANELQSAVARLAIPNPQSQVANVLTVTIGVQFYPSLSEQCQDLEQFISKADKALFNAKNTQRGTIQFLSA